MRRIQLLMLVLMLQGCGESLGPEGELRAWVAAMEADAEDSDRRGMLARISENYADARGNTRDDIGDTLRIYFLRQQEIAILSTIGDIAVYGETAARLDLTVGMAGSGGGRFGLTADAYVFSLELERPDDEWLLIGARWAELGEQLR